MDINAEANDWVGGFVCRIASGYYMYEEARVRHNENAGEGNGEVQAADAGTFARSLLLYSPALQGFGDMLVSSMTNSS